MHVFIKTRGSSPISYRILWVVDNSHVQIQVHDLWVVVSRIVRDWVEFTNWFLFSSSHFS